MEIPGSHLQNYSRYYVNSSLEAAAPGQSGSCRTQTEPETVIAGVGERWTVVENSVEGGEGRFGVGLLS